MKAFYIRVGLLASGPLLAAACSASPRGGDLRGIEPEPADAAGDESPRQGETGSASPDGQAPDDGSSLGALDFCHRWIQEFEAYLETCGCDPTAVEHYRTRNASLCEQDGALGDLARAVVAGDFVYDSNAADALFARLHLPDPPCVKEPFLALGLDSAELYSLAGVFTGTRALGGPCAHPVGYKGGVSDCSEGVCAPSDAGGGVCIALAGLGDACDAAGDDNLKSTTRRLCFDRRSSDSDGEYESAFDALSCVPTSPGAATAVCSWSLANGAPCNSGESCQSGRCLGTGVPYEATCAAKLGIGARCEDHAECDSGACGNESPRVCGLALADGEPCAYDDRACASKSCNQTGDTGGLCGPAPTRAIGETCASDLDCMSSGHGASSSGTCVAGRCIAEVCATYRD